MFNNRITSTTNTGAPGEDQSDLPPLEGLRYDDDLFIQSDDDITPMTDIEENSSGDEVYDKDFLRVHMKSAHDEAMNSGVVNQLSNPSTTEQMKHSMKEVKMTPVVNVTRRDSNRQNLDVLKRNLTQTWCSGPHGNSFREWDDGYDDDIDSDDGEEDDGGGDDVDGSDDGLDGGDDGVDSDEYDKDDENIDGHGDDEVDGGDDRTDSVDIHENHTFPTQLNTSYDKHMENDNVKKTMSPVTASESAEPGLNPLETDPSSNHVYPSGTDTRAPPQVEVARKSMLQKQSSPTDTKQVVRGAPQKGNSQQPATPNHDNEKKKKVKKGINSEASPVCYKRISSSDQKKHKRKSHTYTCEVCDRRFKSLLIFQGHMREHAGEPSPYWCDRCEKRFDRFVTFERHRQRHSQKGRWECSKCGKVYNQRENYFAHLKLHEDPSRNKCEVCGRQYTSPAYLRKHMVVHSEEKPLECPVCEKRFNFKGPFDYHMRKHTLEVTTCKICGLQCYSNTSLAVHMNIHSGKKPHVCKYCGKRFAQRGTKTGHEMTHNNVNKRSLDEESEEQRTKNMLESYDCDQCLMSFTSLELLNGHLKRTHDTIPQSIPDNKCIKPYSCGICGMPFLSVSGLSKHKNKQHPEHTAVRKKPIKEQKIDMVRSFDCDKCLITFSSLERLTIHTRKTHPTLSTETPLLHSHKAKDPKTSKQKSDSKMYQPKSKRRSDSKKDHLTSRERSNLEKDLPTSKQRFDPRKNSLMSKQRSDKKLDLSKSKQRSADGKAEHNTGKKKCSVCGKFVAEYNRHMKIHGERECVCRVCGARFHMACNLKRHMRLHTGEMPFRCNISGERFMKAETLKKHKTRHEGGEL